MIEIEILDALVHFNSDGFLGGIAGLIAFLHEREVAASKKEVLEFRWWALITNVAMGAFVSYIVGTTLAETSEYRLLFVGLSGFSAYSILALTKSKFSEELMNRFLRKD